MIDPIAAWFGFVGIGALIVAGIALLWCIQLQAKFSAPYSCLPESFKEWAWLQNTYTETEKTKVEQIDHALGMLLKELGYKTVWTKVPNNWTLKLEKVKKNVR